MNPICTHSHLLGASMFALALSITPLTLNANPSGPLGGGILVGDLSLDKVLITRDLDGNGDVESAGEVSSYFDETNLSGLPQPTRGVFSLHQGRSGYQYVGDGNTDTVYRLDDANHDGDANDANEATVWFSDSDNAAGLTLPTPNGIFEASDGAVYIVNAGVSSRPTDGVYRTEDLNGDGDANDEGEATLWLDLGVLAASLTGTDPNRSSAFDIAFIGKTAYIADTMGGEADVIFRARDRNNNGVIDAGELSVFIDENNIFGAPVATGLTVLGKALYVSESSRSAHQRIFRLRDNNKSGTIDDALEAVEVWNESQVPADVELGSSFGLTMTSAGELYLTSAGSDMSDNVFRLIDLDADGRYLSEGETIVWRSGQGPGEAVEFARSLTSIPDFLAGQGYFAVSDVNSHNDLPKDINEIMELLAVVAEGGVPDYRAIYTIYSEGKFSVKPNGDLRTIKGFVDGVDRSTSVDLNRIDKNFDSVFPEAVAYYGRADFIGSWLDHAINGVEDFAEASDAQRAVAIEEGLRVALSYWVRFELRLSELNATNEQFSCEQGAPHHWDESFAFYYGPKGKYSLYAFAQSLEQEFDLTRSINKKLVRSFRKGLKRLVPDRPLPGQSQCQAISRNATYSYRQQQAIEKQLTRTFLLGLLHNAERITYSDSVKERRLAHTRAQAYYLAIAPQIYQLSPYVDRRLQKLLTRPPHSFTGLKMQWIILWRLHNLLDLY